jgi:hypothetical protein
MIVCCVVIYSNLMVVFACEERSVIGNVPVVQHKSDGEEVEEERRAPRIRPKALRARHTNKSQQAYDPFKLVPCQAFTPANPVSICPKFSLAVFL